MEYVLEMKDIVKDFSGLKAVNGVDFSISKGETVAIIGLRFRQEHVAPVYQRTQHHYVR